MKCIKCKDEIIGEVSYNIGGDERFPCCSKGCADSILRECMSDLYSEGFVKEKYNPITDELEYKLSDDGIKEAKNNRKKGLKK